MKLYFVSPGKVSLLGWKLTVHPNQMNPVSALPYQISDAHGDMSQPEFDELLSSDSLADSLILWNLFLSYPRHDNRNLSTFWMSYVDMVGDILLGLIRTSGGGNWQLHLFAIWEMFPWYFTYDRLNYARYLPAYNPQINNLQTDHPQVYQHFSNGGLSAHLADDNPFGRIPVDQATYVTVNKDTHTGGGTTK